MSFDKLRIEFNVFGPIGWLCPNCNKDSLIEIDRNDHDGTILLKCVDCRTDIEYFEGELSLIH